MVPTDLLLLSGLIVSCSGLSLLYNSQQSQYCLVPAVLSDQPQHAELTVTITCRLALVTASPQRPLHRVKLSILHNSEDVRNSSRHSFTLLKTSDQNVREVVLQVRGFTEEDTGSYTCRAGTTDSIALVENTTLVLIHSSHTPCIPEQQDVVQPRVAHPARLTEPRILLSILLAAAQTTSFTPQPPLHADPSPTDPQPYPTATSAGPPQTTCSCPTGPPVEMTAGVKLVVGVATAGLAVVMVVGFGAISTAILYRKREGKGTTALSSGREPVYAVPDDVSSIPDRRTDSREELV